MLIQFTLQDLMIFLVCALGIAAGILLLPILWNIKRMVGVIKPLVESNQEFVKKTMKTMPGIFENVGQISSNVRDTTDKLKVSLPVILKDVEYAANAAKGSIESAGVVMGNMGSEINETVADYKKDTSGFMAYFRIIEEIVQIIYRTFAAR
jgi:hypothetical protein